MATVVLLSTVPPLPPPPPELLGFVIGEVTPSAVVTVEGAFSNVTPFTNMSALVIEG